MSKILGSLVLIAAALFANPMRADTFRYTLTEFGTQTWTWTLNGAPHTLPILPQFSSQVGQPGDIYVSYDGGRAEPNFMSMTATTLLFQCDPTLLCGWDEAAEMDFESTTPLLNGTELLTGSFSGKPVFFWSSGLELTVTEEVAESSTGLMLLLGLGTIGAMGWICKEAGRRMRVGQV